jgi:hypothetical protein
LFTGETVAAVDGFDKWNLAAAVRIKQVAARDWLP